MERRDIQMAPAYDAGASYWPYSKGKSMTKIRVILVGIVMALVVSMVTITSATAAPSKVAATVVSRALTTAPVADYKLAQRATTVTCVLRVRHGHGSVFAKTSIFGTGRTWYVSVDTRYQYCTNPYGRDWARATGATGHTNREGTSMTCNWVFTTWRHSIFTMHFKDATGRNFNPKFYVPCNESTVASYTVRWGKRKSPRLFRTAYGVPTWSCHVKIDQADSPLFNEDGDINLPTKKDAKDARKMGKAKFASG